MRVAIIQDELIRKGGSEQVLLSFHNAFPDAPIYTLSYNPETTYPELKECNIITSWFGRYIKDDKMMKRLFFPFGIIAMSQMHVTGYDVILQSTTHCSKYIKTDPDTLVITYCHTPFRLVWRPDSYEEVANASPIKQLAYKTVINILKYIDRKSAERTDWFLTNAKKVVKRIVTAYNPRNEVSVINPSVKCKNFTVSGQVGDYYLMVSRFEPYKKVDLVIDAFNSLPHKKLIIVGKGSMENELKSIAKENITFMNGVDAERLKTLYAECKALIFPQLEDYGITPLEANASGRPVIAYGHGGIKDTMIPYSGDASKATALFFEEQKIEDLLEALEKFDTLSFDPQFIRAHAERFDEKHFVRKIKNFVNAKYEEQAFHVLVRNLATI